jgi:hypothetical protein
VTPDSSAARPPIKWLSPQSKARALTSGALRETTYLGGATLTFPGYLVLSPGTADTPDTFTAKFSQANPFNSGVLPTTIGSVTVPMANPVGGVAVTSHDPSQLTTATFDNGFVF